MTRSSNWRGCVTIVSRSVLLTVPRAWCSLQILNVNNRFLRLSIYWETEIYVVGNPVVPTNKSALWRKGSCNIAKLLIYRRKHLIFRHNF
jgi:hypothetical protein